MQQGVCVASWLMVCMFLQQAGMKMYVRRGVQSSCSTPYNDLNGQACVLGVAKLAGL